MKWKPVLVAILLPVLSLAQKSGINYFIDQIKDNSNKQVFTRVAIHDNLSKLDTSALKSTLNELEKASANYSKPVQVRVAALKSRLLFYQLVAGDSLYAAQMKAALYKAYELDEPFMIAEYSRWYSEMLNSLKKRNDAIQYAMNALVLEDQLGVENFPTVNTFYLTIGELFQRTRNSREAIQWLNKGLALPGRDTVLSTDYANGLNNLASAHFAIDEFKQSLDAYQRCMEYSRQHNLDNWYMSSYINRFMPYIELGRYDSCRVIVDTLYKQVHASGDPYALAGACYFYGQLANRLKDYAAALTWLKKAEAYTIQTGIKAYRMKICNELSASYAGLKQHDLSLVYYKEYRYLNDSSKTAEASVRSDYLLAKANFEKEQLELKRLQKKKEALTWWWVAGIGIVILASVAVITWIYRRHKKAKHAQQEAEQQLLLFAENIIEKDKEIEGLRAQMQSLNSQQAEKVEELSQQIILTDEDWQRFQQLFNTTYPGFLHKLRQQFAGITEAEIRMACCIKINLNTKQISAMQGISPDSVHKTRQRLRQRFSTTSTAELEAIIAEV